MPMRHHCGFRIGDCGLLELWTLELGTFRTAWAPKSEIRNLESAIPRYESRAVLIEATTIASISLPSWIRLPSKLSLTIFASTSISIQKTDSSASSSTTPSFEQNSFFDLARHAAR